ncbi:MAG: bifunctional alpha,alpha-trehalose-phosphate synthase (UDP-forming)/trehalose-phosphatase, partial [Bacteroidales bacterium]|jgi:trehalose 6-phosphate synthase/phosphatase|nr:bifunctional alpha,alpha-trehalose-phosphate synthase (UDP-forming)/trehalose-phosphatase [Bacteroidales bacterium]
MRIFIISNRLPIRIFRNEEGKIEFQTSEGGLATGLNSLNTSYEKHWIGWPGMYVDSKKEKAAITEKLSEKNFHPLFLSARQINYYYEEYSNSTLWPLFHYFYSFIEYDKRYWETYKEVNSLFAKMTLQFIRPGDIIWVQDYHLMLVPQLLREAMPDIIIGYFHHVPFPSYELFRVLPERAELLNGLLGADLVGFHTSDYMRHFISAVRRVLKKKAYLDVISLDRRKVLVNAFPMGINYKKYHDAPLNSEVKKYYRELNKTYGNLKLILSVDRLDYSKGIIHRIKGFSQFLSDYPEYQKKVSLIMVIVPSRNKVLRYAKLKRQIDETVSSINGIYSKINWTPIYYFYHSLPFEELCALYHRADVALLTPLRDGMNLVSKEYVAAKRNRPGVLILSEMAGASIELDRAIIINPNDIEQIEKSILKALTMPVNEQKQRMKEMQKMVDNHNVQKWAASFVEELVKTNKMNKKINDKVLVPEITSVISRKYASAENRLLLFDYDGTLSAFYDRPEDAYPKKDVISLLRYLISDKKNNVMIISGRDRHNLEEWFGKTGMDMEAEHGAAYKRNGVWYERESKIKWNREILKILNAFVDKTPGAHLEEKETALVWHYRGADQWIAGIREQQLVDTLISPCSRLGLQIMRGSDIVEIKSPEFTKSSGIREVLNNNTYDFILCMGDDVTDEDMFRVLPNKAFTIKIGSMSENARYNMPDQSEVLDFIKKISSKKSDA